MITQKIGCIGYGNMSGAIISGALLDGILQKEQIYIYDINQEIVEKARALGLNICKSTEDLAKNSDIIILGVKPQHTPQALAETKGALDGKALFSIVAGITVERYHAMIQGNTRILRIMPNTPAMVLEGAFALCSECTLTEVEKNIANEIFEAIGIVEWVPEKLIDAVCGLSGGGPAYTAMFIEAMADGGVKQGLPRTTAYRLAAQTVLGAAKMILELDMHPGVLKDMVTSPGGTTIEGCEALERGGMRYAVIDCINAASEKSRRL